MLSVRDLSVRYGAVAALSHLDLDVPLGEITGLVGPNGAGKTTAIDAISGLARYTGTVTLDGKDISRWSAHRRARLGLSRTFQRGELFEGLTVGDNLRVGLDRSGAGGGRNADLDEIVETLGLTDALDSFPAELPHGVRRLTDLGRALAMAPRMLLLDEPAAGLDRHQGHQLGIILRRVADRGVGVLIIDHDAELVFDLCDTVAVLVFGSLLEHGQAAEVRASEQVSDAYLGVAAVHEPGDAP